MTVPKFASNVRTLALEVPVGKVTTYGANAKKRGSRAVGAALRSNPTQIVVPCQRVVRAMEGWLM